MIRLAGLVWGIAGRRLGGPLDVNLAGCCAALRGPNGCGKTTLLRTLSGVIPPLGGTVGIGGHDLLRDGTGARRRLGWAPDRIPVPGSTTVRELLELVRWAKRLPASALAGGDTAALGVETLFDRPLQTCSLGQQRRSVIAAALLGDPDVLLLDEPDNGLDDAGLDVLVACLRRRAGQGRTTLFSAHRDILAVRTQAAAIDLAT